MLRTFGLTFRTTAVLRRRKIVSIEDLVCKALRVDTLCLTTGCHHAGNAYSSRAENVGSMALSATLRFHSTRAGRGSSGDTPAVADVPDVAGFWQGVLRPAFAPTSPIAPALEVFRRVANAALEAVDSPMRLHPTRLQERVTPNEKKVRPNLSTWSGKTVVANEDVQEYVDAILSAPDSLVNHPWVPDVLERQVYMLVVKLVLQMIHFACGVLDERRLFGQTLHMVQSRSEFPLQSAEASLTQEVVDRLVDQISIPKDTVPIISDRVDRVMYENVVRFALRLMIDMVSSMRVSCFGMHVRFSVAADPENAAQTHRRSALDSAAFEAACQPLIDELLKDDQINFAYVPDALEKQLYGNILLIVANLMAGIVDSADIDIFGIHVSPDLA